MYVCAWTILNGNWCQCITSYVDTKCVAIKFSFSQWSSLDGRRHKDIQLIGVHDFKSAQEEEDNHEYETNTYMNTLPQPLPVPSPPPLILDSCPADGITTQGQSTSDEDPEAHYSVVDDVQWTNSWN